jgi:hypothetical protein
MAKESVSERLNQSCFCRRTDQDRLQRALAGEVADAGLRSLLASRSGLFSDAAIYLPRKAIDRMEATAHAIENVAQLPAYKVHVLSGAPEISSFEPGPSGAFMGYDFHVTGDEPSLIEVNTNAGGAFLNAALAKAQRACCTDAGLATTDPVAGGFENAVFRMFQAEWTKQGRDGQPGTVAIIDDDPVDQYLYPDMLLAQRALQHTGVETWIADAGELAFQGGVLTHRARPIDLVYNRLTDFSLQAPEHAALRAAYLEGAVVLTPNPAVHALFADKRNLAIFSDPELLQRLGASTEDCEVLAGTVPRTIAVTNENAANLWTERRRYFFKPAAGYGGKAAYRGDKLTKAVWASILAGNYVAQRYIAPGARSLRVEGSTTTLKTDIRLYRYYGETLLFAARLYQGQTTNFRTTGGGFAAVFVAD